MKGRIVSLLLTLLLAGICDAEVLHSWVEPQPDHAFQNDHGVEYPFYTYTSKSAERSESGSSWSLTASATASANARAALPGSGDVSRQWDADAQLRATGDMDTLKPDPADDLAKTEDGIERTLTSSDGTTTARTKRKAHVVYYQNRTFGSPDQRPLDASTSGGKSETSSSPSGLDADPWASSWLEVRRRINLNNPVDGSPFTSTTPNCESSGDGHTCPGSGTPQQPQTVHCERGAGCQNPPGVEGNRKAHAIKCPERTYKQGAWQWLLIKLKEDCKGEKWSCHSDPDNCRRKHLHITAVSSESGSVINGIFVPAGYSIGACGEHMYPSSGSASSHALQASCSTDTNCISTNFYQCQHTEHEYPLETRVRCGNPGTASWACSEGGYAESTHAHILYCDGGHRFWGCNAGTLARHRLHGLSMSIHDTTSSGNADDVSSNENDSGGGEDNDGEAVVLVACGNTATGTAACSSGGLVPQADTHQTTCRAGHTYWGCNPSEAANHSRHVPNMICGNTSASTSSRCLYTRIASSEYAHQSTCAAGHTYWRCSSSETTEHRSHTASDTTSGGSADDDSDDDNNAPSAPTLPTPPVTYEPCGIHTTGTPGTPDSHHWVTCPTNSSGQNCSSGGYYACQSHRHSYPSTPSVSYHVCGIHTTNVGGSHRWVTCPTNSSGQNCSSGGYYACQSHRHSYPSPPAPAVVCPANSWTGCRGTVSHATTCPAGHSYYSCNPEAVSAHSGHTAPAPVVCPANSWTGCGGTSSHATTCGRGHTYYTCNSSAVSSHSGHNSSGNNSSSNNSSSNNSSSNNSSSNNSSSNNSSANNSSSNNSTVTLIYCSGCWQVVSSASQHQTTCGQGHSYYGCNSYYVSQHSSHSSSSNNSSSNNSSANNSSSNNSSSNNSSGNNSPVIVCPANRWTNCGGTVSHATTCGRGHSYYTCNPNAVRAHSWH